MRTHEKSYECNDQHPFIVRYDAAFEDGGNLQMEYSSRLLRHWLRLSAGRAHGHYCVSTGHGVHSQPEDSALRHKGENVLVANDGTPRICDSEGKDMTAHCHQQCRGTRGFMAPEIMSGQSKPTVASDMFAFGVLVLNTVCELGAESYPLTNPSKVTDPALKELLPRLLSRDPSSRPTAAQLLAEPYFASDAVDEWGRVDVGQLVSHKSCRQEMLDADARALGVPEITSVVAQIDSRMATLAIGMDDDEKNRRFTVFLYTIHSNVYPTFNSALRERPPGARFDAWRPFLWHLLAVLRSLPDISRIVYRGIDTDDPRYHGPPLTDYKMSAKIHWSGFSHYDRTERSPKRLCRRGRCRVHHEGSQRQG